LREATENRRKIAAFYRRDAEDAEKTVGNCCPVPLRRTGRYKNNGYVNSNVSGNSNVNGNVNNARLKRKSRRPLQSQKRLCAVEGG
jgi:hypothetical protein